NFDKIPSEIMKLKNIITALLLLINSIVFSQNAENKSKLAVKTVRAYQIKSENKIKEFYSYLNILGKTEVNPELKQQTITEIKKLFKNENSKIPNFVNETAKEISLNDFIDLVAKSNENCFFIIENMSESYVQTDTKNQSWWTIGYTLQVSKGKAKHTIRNIMQNVTLLQEEKQFGKNTKTVWSTYLTNVWLK
ncbi:hypothetical protein, partial [Flavobacterium sp.]|uniref:hypothetical protein n=1 Tax=Flavobacterium sp. TaxID=239 RepID=UPI00374D0CAC